jgi:hypothetical protein
MISQQANVGGQCNGNGKLQKAEHNGEPQKGECNSKLQEGKCSSKLTQEDKCDDEPRAHHYGSVNVTISQHRKTNTGKMLIQ